MANKDKILFAESVNGVLERSGEKTKVYPKKKERAINPKKRT